ncbi:nucleotide-binding protein [Pleurocapsa sp. FMAR1]|uniref:nucleotide-binding protein n=1 Tax=Pleurocapsa sp. FMAR1 TaxID=3040204 RepID=UPI0029C8FFCF|nr:nucleotide-binding protein [Pleurocapsa sp. FMAR1]
MNEFFSDNFPDDLASGKTIGSKTAAGIERKGIDREKAIAIDNHALRFKPLIQPGWGRQGIAYGKYQRANGLTMAVLLLNGHNTSQAETIEWLYKRIPRWLKGSETESILKRVTTWLGSQHKSATPRRLLSWFRMAAEVTKFFPLPKINDNLAVGWFTDAVPSNLPENANNFVIRATGAENGELLAKVGTKLLSILRGLQNVPVCYVVILREQGAAYYAASIPQVYGLPSFPQLRPVAIDTVNLEPTLYAGVYQSVLGQIGFRADTRVYGVKVETISALATWYGTAHGADALIGTGNLASVPAEAGGAWQIIIGSFERTKQGLIATQSDSLAILKPQTTSGLLHAKICFSNKESAIAPEDKSATIGIVWRFQDRHNYWCCEIDNHRICLQLIEAGQKEVLVCAEDFLIADGVGHLQILDDGQEVKIYFDGQLIGNYTDERLATATGVGIAISNENSDLYLQNFEAHPRTVTLPTLDFDLPWWQEGKDIVIEDDFNNWEGDLSGKTTLLGNQVWQKTIGKGVFEILQSGIAKVKADVANPNPDRTAYTVAVDNSSFADVSVTIVPPGKERGQGEKGRGGLIFWQDKDNYIIINTWLDDFYEGESISCFFRIAGFEEIYDAVWSNIGRAIAFGQPYTLRIVFDGNHYSVRVNNQTVLYRALTDVYPWANALKINRVGIVANWEWGNDTGSGFSNFIVRKSDQHNQ